MAVVETVQVPEAFVEVTVCSSEGQSPIVGRRQRPLYRSVMQENYRTMTTLGGFPVHTSELLSRLDRGEEAWVPDLQSSEDSADEGPVKPTLKRPPKRGAWWDWYRSPVMYHSSDSSNSDDEQESETEEEKPQRAGHRLMLLHRNVLANSKGSLKPRETCKNWLQLKKYPRSQAARMKCNIADAGDINVSTAKKKTSEWNTCPACGQSFKSKLSLSNHQRIHIREAAYKCTICGERFTAKKVLASHHRRHAEEKGYKHPCSEKRATKHPKVAPAEGPYKCPECEKCFHLKKNLLQHQRSHAAEGPHKCPECEKRFHLKMNLLRHQRSHAAEGPHKCPECEKRFHLKMNLLRHQRSHAAGGPHKCPECEKRFHLKMNLLQHQRSHEAGGPHKCPECDKRFHLKMNLLRHQRSHAAGGPHKCPECEKRFHLKMNLLRHQRSHAAEGSHKCPVCGKGFIRKEHLTRHQKIHTRQNTDKIPKGQEEARVETSFRAPEKKLSIAPVCERTVILDIGDTRHQRIHTNLYKCQFCEKSLRSKIMLIEHERTHTEKRPYKCSWCKKSFYYKQRLQNHEKTHRRPLHCKRPRRVKGLSRKSSSSYFGMFHTEHSSRSPISRKVITRSSCLTQRRNIHVEKKLHKCQYCGKCLSSKNGLTNHERIHRGEKPYKCDECGKCFRQKNHLVKHLGTHKSQKPYKHIEHVRRLKVKGPLTVPNRTKKGWKPYKGLNLGDTTRTSHLTRHPKIPTESSLFKCQYCGKCTRTKSSLLTHERIHKGRKPYQCLECGKKFSQKNYLGCHQRSHMRKKDSKCSDPDKEITTKYSLLTRRNPHSEKLPCICLKCGKRFSENYHLKRHQKIHSGTKPFSCATCGKAFIQKWHLKRHETIHLKETHPKQPKVHEVNCVFSSSTSDLFSVEKDPVSIKPQIASRTIEKNTSPNIKEGETGPLAVLMKGSEVKISQRSERGEMHTQTELQVFSSRKSKGKVQQNQRVVRQLVKLRRKLTRKDNVLLCYKQDKHYIRQPVQPRKLSKKEHGIQSCKKERVCASQQLGSQVMATRKSKRDTQLAGKQARSCFCQQEKPEITPGRKSPNPQTCKKVNSCKGPQKMPRISVSSKLPKNAPKFCKPTTRCLDQPSWSTFLPESKMAEGSLTSVEQQMELQEVLEREPKGYSVSWSRKAKKCESVDAAERVRRQALPETIERNTQPSLKGLLAGNELKSSVLQNLGVVSVSQQMEAKAAPGSLKKGRESRRTISKDPQSRAPKKKVITDQGRSEKIQAKHICTLCKKSFRSRGNLLIHEKNHSGNRPFLCIYCGKRFYNTSTLRVHVRIHTGEKPFKCSECTFCCNVSSNLSRHKRTHVRERPHPCPQCGKRFWFRHSLLIHSRIHNKKEPHKCCECGRVFTHENFLKLHRRYKHHSEVEFPHSGEEQHLLSGELGLCETS